MNLKTKRYILMFFMGFLYAAQNAMPWFYTYYTKAMEAALGFTATQFGNLISMFGIIALFMYIFTGILSDKVSAKSMLVTASFATGALTLLMAFRPSYLVMIFIQIGFAITVVMAFYGGFVKFTRTLGSKEEQGRMYGWQFAFNGLNGMLLGFAGSGIYAALINKLDAVITFRWMLILYAVFNVLPGIILLFMYNEKRDTFLSEEDQNEKFQFKYVGEVIKMPAVWLIALMGFCSYCFKCSGSYFTPYLTDAFAIPVVMVNFISIIRSYAVRMVMNPISGIVIDKLKSATKVMTVVFIIGLVIILSTLLLPASPSLAIVGVILVILIFAAYNLSVPCWYTPITEAGIPNKYYGTIVGIVSAVAFAPDAFFYSIGGSLLDKYGDQGYTRIFALVLAIVTVGLIISIVLRKMIKKNAEKQSIAETQNA